MGTFGYLAPEYAKDEILNMKNSLEFKKEFLWAEASLVELKLVLINVRILQLFLDMVGANLMMLAGNSTTWDPEGGFLFMGGVNMHEKLFIRMRHRSRVLQRWRRLM